MALPWSPCEPWSAQDKEPEELEVKKQTKGEGGQRSHQKRSEEKSDIADETVGMDKGKVKPLGGAKRASGNKQQGGGAELDDEWQVVQEEVLQVRITCKCKSRNSSIYSIPYRLLYLCLEKP